MLPISISIKQFIFVPLLPDRYICLRIHVCLFCIQLIFESHEPYYCTGKQIFRNTYLLKSNCQKHFYLYWFIKDNALPLSYLWWKLSCYDFCSESSNTTISEVTSKQLKLFQRVCNVFQKCQRKKVLNHKYVLRARTRCQILHFEY